MPAFSLSIFLRLSLKFCSSSMLKFKPELNLRRIAGPGKCWHRFNMLHLAHEGLVLAWRGVWFMRCNVLLRVLQGP